MGPWVRGPPIDRYVADQVTDRSICIGSALCDSPWRTENPRDVSHETGKHGHAPCALCGTVIKLWHWLVSVSHILIFSGKRGAGVERKIYPSQSRKIYPSATANMLSITGEHQGMPLAFSWSQELPEKGLKAST